MIKYLISLLLLFVSTGVVGQSCYTSAHNMVGYSEDLTNATGWTKVATMADTTASTMAAPRVYNISKTFSATLTAGQSNILYGNNHTAMVNLAPYVFSVYSKYSTRQFIGLGIAGGSTWGCSYDIQNGIAGVCNGNFSSPTITSAGDGWYKLEALYTGFFASFPNARLSITNQTNASTFTVLAATGGEVVYLSSPQIQNVITGVSTRERSKYVPNTTVGTSWAPAISCESPTQINTGR